ncbi:MAG: DUF3500 domain-containing protein [Chloroflexi bacterium]|nr:DUF3500 domain-containing protein [Chloroflexota bacterium]MDA1145630.1 DUF3500 domain-containing protein [Chloroflexota bacterium]
MTTATSPLTSRIAAAADDFLEMLEPEQLEAATFAFANEDERTRFFYTPTDHGGIEFVDMWPQQHAAAMRLLAATLSPGAYSTAATIMGLENVLAGLEGFVDFDHDADEVRTRNPNRYHVSVFGTPGEEPWGWRFGGHHVSVSLLAANGEVRLLPSFLGANPASYDGVGANHIRPLAAEEDLGRELVHLLNEEQLATALLSPTAPPDLVTINSSRLATPTRTEAAPWKIWRSRTADDFTEGALSAVRTAVDRLGEEHLAALEYTAEPKGIRANALDSGQRVALAALLRQYIARMPDELAATELARIEGIDDAAMTFAWAGGLERGQGHYYRIQGPGLLVEYDNTQNDANHIHAVWRDPERDFGRDLLAEHYSAAH